MDGHAMFIPSSKLLHDFFTASERIRPLLYAHSHNIKSWFGVSESNSEVSINFGMSRLRMHMQADERSQFCLAFDSGINEGFLGCPLNERKVAVMWEPRGINAETSKFLEENGHKVDLILTHDQKILRGFPSNSRLVNAGGAYIGWGSDFQCQKTQCRPSISVSGKRLLPGHTLRHKIVRKFGASRLIVMGNGYHPYHDPAEPYRKFMFSVAVENVREPGWFTEKLIHPLLFRCIPVYWGPNELPDAFDSRGIMQFETINELRSHLDHCTPHLYREKIEAIKHNQRVAFEYMSSDLNIQKAVSNFFGWIEFSDDTAEDFLGPIDDLAEGIGEIWPSIRAL